jgi:hypothetical protein
MKRLFALRVKPLLVFGLLSAALLLPHGGVFAADPNHVVQLRETKKCEGCDLSEANLTIAFLYKAHLTGANLSGAILSDARLWSADLTGANLSGAHLTGASLLNANLSGARLWKADLIGANLTGANLSEAYLPRAKLSHAVFEPAKIPPVTSLSASQGLHKLRWERSPQGLVLLRNAFKDAGMRRQEREVTYAQMRWQRRHNGGLEGALQFAAFEATSAWGMAPARPIWILLALIPFFALLYMVPIARPSSGAKLWRVWDKDRARKDQVGQDDPEWLLARGYRVPLYALFFSVLSAFHIGWKELSIGSWIARLNPYEYTLKATGWVRTVSGVQSLISVYLLALAVLTYFGRPFE